MDAGQPTDTSYPNKSPSSPAAGFFAFIRNLKCGIQRPKVREGSFLSNNSSWWNKKAHYTNGELIACHFILHKLNLQ